MNRSLRIPTNTYPVHIFNSKVFDLYFSATLELPELINRGVNTIWERSGWERHKIINIIIGKFHKLIPSGHLQWNRENIQNKFLTTVHTKRTYVASEDPRP